ncbi:hypothetical protein D3C76_602350 [compost metagenome]
MIHHAESQTGQAIVERTGFAFTCHQDRLIYRVGGGKRDVLIARLKSVGGAQQVDLAVFERFDCSSPGGKTLNLDGQAEGLAQYARVIGSKSFVVMAATGEVEGGVVWCRGTQDQFGFTLDPVSL